MITDTITLQLSGDTIAIERTAGIACVINESIFGGGQYIVDITDKSPTVWNTLGEQGVITGSLRITTNTSGLDKQEITSKWKEFRVAEMHIRPNGDVFDIRLVGYNAFYDMRHRASQRMINNIPIKDAITAVVTAHGLLADIANTSSPNRITLRQGLATDFEFLTQELLPRYHPSTLWSPVISYIRDRSTNDAYPTFVAIDLTTLAKQKAKLKYAYSLPQDEVYEYDPIHRAFLGNYLSSRYVQPSNYGVKGVTFDTMKSSDVPWWLKTYSMTDANPAFITFPGVLTPPPIPLGSVDGVMSAYGGVATFPQHFNGVFNRTTARFNETYFTHRLEIPTPVLAKAEIGAIAEVDATLTNGLKLNCTGPYVIYALTHRFSPEETGTKSYLGRRGTMKV